MTRNSNTLELHVELVFVTSTNLDSAPPPTLYSWIFSFALSYLTSCKQFEYVGITATSVEILPSLRSAATHPVAQLSPLPKVTLTAYTRNFDVSAACHESVFLTLAFVQSDVVIVNAI